MIRIALLLYPSFGLAFSECKQFPRPLVRTRSGIPERLRGYPMCRGAQGTRSNNHQGPHTAHRPLEYYSLGSQTEAHAGPMHLEQWKANYARAEVRIRPTLHDTLW